MIPGMRQAPCTITRTGKGRLITIYGGYLIACDELDEVKWRIAGAEVQADDYELLSPVETMSR